MCLHTLHKQLSICHSVNLSPQPIMVMYNVIFLSALVCSCKYVGRYAFYYIVCEMLDLEREHSKHSVHKSAASLLLIRFN